MQKKYNEQEIYDAIKEAIQKDGISQFYKANVVNYKIDINGRPCSEIVADWILINLPKLDDIIKINRAKSYKTKGHDGKAKTTNSNRYEELLAMAMFLKKDFSIIGKILDYQVPLKNIQSDKAGKIDLLAYNEAENIVYILELKKEDSKETMLRCILEAYTYFKTIKDESKFLNDFILPKDKKPIIKVSPLVAYGGHQYNEMQSDNCPKLKKLMKTLNIEPLYYKFDIINKL